jgi:hypothetical protein
VPVSSPFPLIGELDRQSRNRPRDDKMATAFAVMTAVLCGVMVTKEIKSLLGLDNHTRLLKELNRRDERGSRGR